VESYISADREHINKQVNEPNYRNLIHTLLAIIFNYSDTIDRAQAYPNQPR
jgi:hypothetical protein